MKQKKSPKPPAGNLFALRGGVAAPLQAASSVVTRRTTPAVDRGGLKILKFFRIRIMLNINNSSGVRNAGIFFSYRNRTRPGPSRIRGTAPLSFFRLISTREKGPLSPENSPARLTYNRMTAALTCQTDISHTNIRTRYRPSTCVAVENICPSGSRVYPLQYRMPNISPMTRKAQQLNNPTQVYPICPSSRDCYVSGSRVGCCACENCCVSSSASSQAHAPR